MFCVYQIKNILNNKSYIGSSANYSRRFNEHKSRLRNNKHANQHLQNAWNKYGEENFVFNVIKMFDAEKEMNLFEAFEINKDFGSTYNIRPDARSNRGYKHSEETKQKIRDSLKGRDTMPSSSRARMAEALRGKKKPPHVKAASLAAVKNLWKERGHEMRRKCRKLSDNDVIEIRRRIEKEKEILNGKRFRPGGLRYAELGKEFGVSSSVISNIWKGKKYIDV